MLVSYKWLSEYVDLQGISAETLADRLTKAGLEVDAVHYRDKGVTNVVVGYVTEKASHPDADKLSVCKVDVGEKEALQIVCGAKNVAQGQKVPVALVGAVLPGNFKIKKAKLRGVVSQGMICSAKELGIEDKLLSKEQQEGILVLPEDAVVGENVMGLLGLDDVVLDIDLTPNRSDCLSMIGLAYEVAALFQREVSLPSMEPEEKGNPLGERIRIDIRDPEHCPYYTARLIKNVRLGPSPLWMQNMLMASGIRPINNVVDITNYVMLETGQPLHAFDYRIVKDGRIVVRLAEKDEMITTLDDVERTLDEEMLLIADPEKAVGIAGVMGGANSEVTSDTTDILLESARFDGVSIRKTSRKLALRSEASLRFEKEVDPQGVKLALNRAAQLMERYAEGVVEQGVAEAGEKPQTPPPVGLRVSRTNQILGTDLNREKIRGLMEQLHFEVQEESDDRLLVTVPSRRHKDLVREIDLIEEAARIYGYDRIPTTLPSGAATVGGLTDDQAMRRTIRRFFNAAGMDEVSTYSLTTREEDRDVEPLHEGNVEPVRVAMPMSEERSVLRTNLLPSLLQVARYNHSHRNEDLSVFEIGKVFLTQEKTLSEQPEEVLHLAGLLTGRKETPHWDANGRKVDFFDLKGILESLLDRLQIRGVTFQPARLKGMHPGRTARLLAGEGTLGYLGQLHPETQEAYGLNETYVFQVDLRLLRSLAGKQAMYEPLPKYPAVTRDLAIVVADDLEANRIQKQIESSAGEWLESVYLFDVYAGQNIAEGKKSLAFSLTYRAKDRTLTDEEVNERHQRVVDDLQETFGAELR